MQKWAVVLMASIFFGLIGGMTGGALRRDTAASIATPSTLDRVKASGVIRAAYLVRPPNIIKDPNTGELSGIFVDILEEISARSGYKVEWVEEVTWGTMIEGLNTGRYDVVGTGIWRNATRGQAADFTSPLFYSGVGVFVRQSDQRFDHDLTLLNAPSVRIATIDGEMASIIANADFPDAEQISFTQGSDTSQLLLEVQSNKADATFLAAQIGARYAAKNPGAVRNIASATPVRVFPEAMMLRANDYEFKSALDAAITEIVNSDFIEKTIRKHEKIAPESYYLVAPAYRQLR